MVAVPSAPGLYYVPGPMDVTPTAPPSFKDFGLSNDVQRALDELGYSVPTAVQTASIEPIRSGKSLVVQARTGTGKTAAFGIPIIDALVRPQGTLPQALILVPTRELALQVAKELGRIAKHRETRVIAIYGGAPMEKQVDELRSAQVVVGTPGRVLDHLRRGTFDPSGIRIFVLDEADEMLSMGFAKELHAIMNMLPKERQGLYFSATIPPDIERLANSHLREPIYLTLSSDQIGALQISHFVYLLRGQTDRRAALCQILETEDPESAIIFCNTRDETERVCTALQNRGYEAEWLNGDLEQRERERIMTRTKEGKLRFLVCTDVAARGIDISHLTHVINADFPENLESYVHRTGRTGRAGRTGTAISLIGPKDVGNLYMLRITYKIRPIERELPTTGEISTRKEADVVQFLDEAFGTHAPAAFDLAVARRLLTHDSAETILAQLIRGHLGEREQTDFGEARRAKNPEPFVEAAASASPSGGGGAAPITKRQDDLAPIAPSAHVVVPRDRESSRRPAARVSIKALVGSAPPRELRPEERTRDRGERRPRGPRREEVRADDVSGPTDPVMPGITVEDEKTETNDRPPPTRRERPRDRERAEATSAPKPPGSVDLFIKLGRRSGQSEPDLRGWLQESGIDMARVLSVAVRDAHSYVTVPEGSASELVETLSRHPFADRFVVVEIARRK